MSSCSSVTGERGKHGAGIAGALVPALLRSNHLSRCPQEDHWKVECDLIVQLLLLSCNTPLLSLGLALSWCVTHSVVPPPQETLPGVCAGLALVVHAGFTCSGHSSTGW